ncbi:MAG TPA: PEGA domain-containing protein [Vicinamibacterales bacterium]|nr:PEGA domain-containing protein [Vicinamibacterales bacterium]
MLHQIGVGVLGPVFRTYEPTRDRLVAVKVFRLDITPEQARALADELARSAEAGLFHPSVVEPIAAGVEGTVAYRADEYVAAESLDVAMRHYAPASVDKVLPFITQLAGAIDFARAAGVGHGALHPRDIFVTPDEARATGFGVVDALERVGIRAPVRRPYSPPERVSGGSWGTPADVFSLGVIAFELLTGRRPAGTGDQIGPLTGAPGADHLDQLRAVLVRAMDDDPERRYPTALAFASALEAAARGEGQPGLAASASVAVPAADTTSRVESREEASTKPPATGEEPDDIAAEREEDEAHWALAQEEASRRAQPPTPEATPADPRPEPASAAVPKPVAPVSSVDDDLRLHAVSLEEATATGADDFTLRTSPAFGMDEDLAEETGAGIPPETDERDESERELQPGGTKRPGRAAGAAGVVAPFDAHPAAARSRRPAAHTVFDTHDAFLESDSSGIEARPPGERAPMAMLPLAMTLVIGLLLGFAAGYAVGGRSQENDAGATPGSAAAGPGGQPAEPGPAGTTSAPAREFSEQTVAPSSTPPSAAPDAAPDMPAGESGARTGGPAAGTAKPPAPRTGRLVVRSNPPGAGVTINGQWRGRTPLPLDELAFGKYTVRVVQPGYDVAREEVTLSTADPTRIVSLRLNRQAPAKPPARASTPPASASAPQSFTGSVFVDSRPRGARVLIDGKEVGTTPLRIPDVPIGSHVVRLELPDHRFWTTSITVTAGKSTPVTGSLEPIR